MSGSRIGRIGQIKIYVGKCFRTFFNEKGWKSLISTLIMAVVIAWIVGDDTFAIFENTEAGVFAMICGCIWTGLFNSIQSVCRERAIIKREHRTGLHISSYIISHMIFEFVLCLVEAVILTVVFDLFRDFPEKGVVIDWIWLEFFVSFTLITFCADTLGLLVSCVVKTENAAMTVMPFILIIQLVMCGFMFVLPDYAEPVKEVTISKWGLSAICSTADVNELPNNITLVKLEEIQAVNPEIENWKDAGIVQEFEEEYKAETKHIVTCWGVLVGYSVLYGVIGTLLLKLVDKDKR
jgi:hypothetical protein